MPAIPVYQQQTQATGEIDRRIRTNPDEFGAGITQAVSQLGNAAGRVASAEGDAVYQQNVNAAKARTGVVVSKAKLDWDQYMSDRQEAAPPGAQGFAGKIAKIGRAHV